MIQCSVSPDGRWVVIGGLWTDRVAVYSAQTGALVADIYQGRGDGRFSPDGRRLEGLNLQFADDAERL